LDLKPTSHCTNESTWAPIKTTFETLNVTLIKIPHGPPAHKNDCLESSPFTSDVFDKMIEHGWIGPEYMVMMTHGAHFGVFNPIVYYRRLVDIRNAVERYKRVSPESLVILKTMNYFRFWVFIKNFKLKLIIKKIIQNNLSKGTFQKLSSVGSNWHSWRFRELVFRVFGSNNKDPEQLVKIFDVFPMIQTAFNHMEPGNIHPGKDDSPQWLYHGIFDRFIQFLGEYGGLDSRK